MLNTVQVLCWTRARALTPAVSCAVSSAPRTCPGNLWRKQHFTSVASHITASVHGAHHVHRVRRRRCGPDPYGVTQESCTAGNGTDGTEPAKDGCLLKRFTVLQDSRSPAEQCHHGHPLPNISVQHLMAPPEENCSLFPSRAG